MRVVDAGDSRPELACGSGKKEDVSDKPDEDEEGEERTATKRLDGVGGFLAGIRTAMEGGSTHVREEQ